MCLENYPRNWNLNQESTVRGAEAQCSAAHDGTAWTLLASAAVTVLLLFAVAPGGKSSVESNTEEAGNKNAGPAPKTISNFPVAAAFQSI